MSGNYDEKFQKRMKRKRKLDFVGQAKKYGKKGQYGRGFHMSEEKYYYFVRILEMYKAGFSTDEEKRICANNVLKEIENEETNYSCNQLGCRVIETLLPMADEEALTRFITAFDTDLRAYCSDRFASYVLQTLLQICCRDSVKSSNKELRVKCRQFTLKVSRFLLNNLEDFVTDTYGNHIIRTVFTSLADIPNRQPDKFEKVAEETEIPEEYVEIIQEYGKRLLLWPNFEELFYSDMTSALLQMILLALKKTDIKLLKKFQIQILNKSLARKTESVNDGNLLPYVFTSKPATILLETAISVATPKIFTKIYVNFFVNNLVQLAKSKHTVFAVKKLLDFCPDISQFVAIFEELENSFEEILLAGNAGIILSLAQACKRHSAKQILFVTNLMKALHCLEPEDRQNSFVEQLCLKPIKHIGNRQNNFVQLSGSLIIQQMLEFKKPIKIVKSILSISSVNLKNIFCHNNGSHIAETYMKSQYVGDVSRKKLILHMQGTYQELAASKHGSRSLEAMWDKAKLTEKMIIMDELSEKDSLWSGKEFGHIIASKFKLALYKRNKEKWEKEIELIH